MKIIGLSGTNGSGKDTVASMLVERYQFLFADATTMFIGELKKRGQPIDRKHKSALSAEWRREFGMAAIVDKAVEMFNEAPGKYRGLVVGSLRHPGEADRVHELKGTMVWVDADPKLRYQRIISNAHARGRAAEDDKTFEQFMAEEQMEMEHSGDAATLNMSAVKDRADIILNNKGNDIKTFKNDAEKTLLTVLEQ